MTKADQLLAGYQKGDIDILVLPEMAFTGYVFKTCQEIEPYLEDASNGPSVLWAKRQAIRLSCYVVVAYPERYVDGDNIKLYNSQCFVNRQGELIKTYRKSFLYETDEHWASEGPGFETIDIPELGKVGLAICMDINPYQFKTDFYDFEFGHYHSEAKTDIILCSMAWLKNDTKGNDTVMDTINYWALRLLPLMRQSVESDHQHHTLFVACNRIGSERGSTFAGGSSILDLSHSDKAQLLGHMGWNEEGVLLVES
ncbi:carbon-nitrogen hydrolase [Halteromyces radiatus]|uniref:carbon-nitrogen hydrolase n=1 Tax=Halteromyces radiatus TaxID=101107 RepID=UPI00221E39A0|nr:carbon-nitrogen hydrolase [Halteromyces radiatus]KAI8100169.1 carbon-nitrogen hydrolase [Halteromyces radiatus]